MEDEEKMSIYFPEEILVNILQRLPVKTLLRCRSVCKTWYTLISSSHFISTHLNFNTNIPPYLFFGYFKDQRKQDMMQFALYYDHKTFDLHAKFKIPNLLKSSDHSFFEFVGICNGLICLYEHSNIKYKDRINIWNPFLNKVFVVPHPIHIGSKYDYFSKPTLAFGFDSATNDYKVVRILSPRTDEGVYPKIEVYRLNTNIWEDLSHLSLPYNFTNCNSNVVYVNGCAYWIKQEKWEKFMIVMFDMHTELFREMIGGSTLADKYTSFIWNYSLFECQGSLCLVLYYTDEQDHEKFDIWLMNENGGVESWIKQATVDVDHYSRSWLPGLRNNGELLWAKNDGGLVSYNPRNMEVTYLDTRGFGLFEPVYLFARSYVESLVLLDKGVDCLNCDTRIRYVEYMEDDFEPMERKKKRKVK